MCYGQTSYNNYPTVNMPSTLDSMTRAEEGLGREGVCVEQAPGMRFQNHTLGNLTSTPEATRWERHAFHTRPNHSWAFPGVAPEATAAAESRTKDEDYSWAP